MKDLSPEQNRERLARQITEFSAHTHAATYRLLCLIREFDDASGWEGFGMLSCAHWLNWQCGISLGAAREKVRVAHALVGLPAVSAAFSQGAISYSKARAMTRVATPENEADLMNIALHGTAAHMEKLVRCYRRVRAGETLEQAQAQHQARALHYHFDEDGSLVLQARFTPEQGVVVLNAIQAALDAFDGDVSDVAEESDDEIAPAEISAETRTTSLKRMLHWDFTSTMTPVCPIGTDMTWTTALRFTDCWIVTG